MSSGNYAAATRTSALPLIFRGREGRLNALIIRHLALNGPSLIYSVAKFLSETSKTRIHYPTINRRMHDLVGQNYLQKAGARSTKTGALADLYATTVRGDFAAFVVFADGSDDRIAELSPSQVRQIIGAAAKRRGSPFMLLERIVQQGHAGKNLVDKLLVPEVAKSVRNGYLNLEATDDAIICSSFASVLARGVISIFSKTCPEAIHVSPEEGGQYTRILLQCVDRMLAEETTPAADDTSRHLAPVPLRWAKELKVFLRLSAVDPDGAME